jgi:prepilin-type N-terminal cleavage/methylation domain-containing protein
MKRNEQGFTLIEIVVVLVLISIIAATLFTRSITFPQVNYIGQVEKIQNHIRYAKALAMKRSIAEEMWGINCSGNYYWLFHLKDRSDPEYFGAEDIHIAFPGEENEEVSFSKIGVSMNPFVVYFDKYGRPFKIGPYTGLTSNLQITIHTADADVSTKQIVITPETGFITTQ